MLFFSLRFEVLAAVSSASTSSSNSMVHSTSTCNATSLTCHIPIKNGRQSMGSIWLSKKAFLYLGGAFIILLGGAIVYFAPYHYVNFSMGEGSQRTWEMWDRPGYYPQLEISVSCRPGNGSIVQIGLRFQENFTLQVINVNLTLTPDDKVIGPEQIIYEKAILMDMVPGNYTCSVVSLEGVGQTDLGLKQSSDNRLWIVTGGSMNIIGVIMAIAGYVVPGTFLPTSSDMIVEWGYDEEEEEFQQ